MFDCQHISRGGIDRLKVCVQMYICERLGRYYVRTRVHVWVGFHVCTHISTVLFRVSCPDRTFHTHIAHSHCTLTLHTHIAHSHCTQHCTLTLHTHISHSHCTLTFHTHIAHSHCTLTLHTHIAHSHCTLTFHTHISHSHCMLTFHTHISHSHFTLTFHTHLSHIAHSHFTHCTLTLHTHIAHSHCTLTLHTHIFKCTLHTHFSHSLFTLTFHTHIFTFMIKVLKLQGLTESQWQLAFEILQLQHFNHRSDCSVQCVNGSRKDCFQLCMWYLGKQFVCKLRAVPLCGGTSL